MNAGPIHGLVQCPDGTLGKVVRRMNHYVLVLKVQARSPHWIHRSNLLNTHLDELPALKPHPAVGHLVLCLNGRPGVISEVRGPLLQVMEIQPDLEHWISVHDLRQPLQEQVS